VSFPDPTGAGVAIEKDGLQVLSLETLSELKLASGMTAAHRLKGLSDIQQLIAAIGLSKEFADNLNPYVQDKYRELWTGLHSTRPDWEEPNGPH
jgi:hypothetical protein